MTMGAALVWLGSPKRRPTTARTSSFCTESVAPRRMNPSCIDRRPHEQSQSAALSRNSDTAGQIGSCYGTLSRTNVSSISRGTEPKGVTRRGRWRSSQSDYRRATQGVGFVPVVPSPINGLGPIESPRGRLRILRATSPSNSLCGQSLGKNMGLTITTPTRHRARQSKRKPEHSAIRRRAETLSNHVTAYRTPTANSRLCRHIRLRP